MRYIFMGTPRYAEIILEHLVQAGKVPVGIMTQPDQPAGRGKALTPPPVKVLAGKLGIPVRQPRKIGDPTREWMRSLNPEICVVAAYGKILTKATLDMAPHGCINAHASLLPKYRGAAPIAWVLINGDKETGVSIMQIDEGMDTGDVIAAQSIPIMGIDNCRSLAERLARLAGPMLEKVMDDFEKGTVRRIPQSEFEGEPTNAPCLTKKDGNINWNNSSDKVINWIRGMNPWPSAFTTIDCKMLKIFGAEKIDLCPDAVPGTVLSIEKDGVVVAVKDGAIRLIEVQLQGKKVIRSYDFANGYRLKPGKVLGARSE